MGKFTKISRLPEFDKDLKKLLKRFKTIEDDLEIFIENELVLYHKLGIDNKGVFSIPGLPVKGIRIYKAKKFACRSLKGKGAQSGMRVIYTYLEDADTIELIEIYYKGDKENEDRERIARHHRK
jgi:mRNA-degrading endonuclease RelE of RelBE toxin-antitoxin system